MLDFKHENYHRLLLNDFLSARPPHRCKWRHVCLGQITPLINRYRSHSSYTITKCHLKGPQMEEILKAISHEMLNMLLLTELEAKQACQTQEVYKGFYPWQSWFLALCGMKPSWPTHSGHSRCRSQKHSVWHSTTINGPLKGQVVANTSEEVHCQMQWSPSFSFQSLRVCVFE